MRLRKFSIEHLWALAVLGSCFGYVSTLPVEQYDFWHYLKAGQWMLHSHRVLDHDLFAFTIPSLPFVNIHWGSQILFYGVYLLGGIPLMAFFHACLVTAAFALVFLAAVRRSHNLRIATAATFIAFLGSVTNLALRPQGFSILFFGVILWLLEVRHTRSRWLIPIIMLLWANVHGAFIVGLVLVGLDWLGCLPQQGSELSLRERVNPAALATLLAGAAATLVTPWGVRLYPSVFSAEAVSRASFITEWDPPSLHEPTGFIFFTALLGFVVLQQFRKNPWNRRDLLTFTVFTVLALKEQRAVVWWAMAMSPMIAEALRDLFVRSERKSPVGSNPWGWNVVIAGLFLIYLAGCLPWTKAQNPWLPAIKQQLIAADTPIRLTEALAENKEAHRIFNNFSWGGYFIWELRDDQKVFFDPRVLMFPETVMGDYLLITNGYALWLELLDHYRVDTLALGKEDQHLLIPLVKRSPQWKLTYEDDQGMIFSRRGRKAKIQTTPLAGD